MTRRLALMALVVGVLTLGAGRQAVAHEGHAHKVMGTVTMAAADHVMVKDTDGKDVTIKVTKDTKVKSKPAMKVEEIKAGTRVVIMATMDKDKTMTAQSIQVGAPPAATR